MNFEVRIFLISMRAVFPDAEMLVPPT